MHNDSVHSFFLFLFSSFFFHKIKPISFVHTNTIYLHPKTFTEHHYIYHLLHQDIDGSKFVIIKRTARCQDIIVKASTMTNYLDQSVIFIYKIAIQFRTVYNHQCQRICIWTEIKIFYVSKITLMRLFLIYCYDFDKSTNMIQIRFILIMSRFVCKRLCYIIMVNVVIELIADVERR